MKTVSNLWRRSTMLAQSLQRAAAPQRVRAGTPDPGGRVRAFLCSGGEGAALAEFALLLPVIFLLMTGIFSFSVALDQKLQLDEAVGAGGRFLAVQRGNTNTDPCALAATMIENSAPSLTPSKFNFSMVIGGAGGGTFPSSGFSNAPSCPLSKTLSMTQEANVSIWVQYPYALKVYGVTYAAGNFNSAITEVTQ
jgi:Flp pilus assembly protein TadG